MEPLQFYSSNENLEFSWKSISTTWNGDNDYSYSGKDHLYLVILK